ncbi:MAG: WD40 repeat domain-containing protein [Phycisphaeraceae bacterium JB051]
MVICLSTVNSLNAQTLSFPATRAEQQYVIQATLQTPLNLRSVCFSADGKTLYVGAYKQVLVWSLSDAKLAATLTDPALSNMVTSMSLCNDGKTLAVSAATPGSSTAPIVLFETSTNKKSATLQQTGDTVQCMFTTKAGKQLFVGTYDGQLTLWDVPTQKVEKAFAQQGSAITGITADDKENWIAVCNHAGQVEVFDAADQFAGVLSTTLDDKATSVFFENGKTSNLAVAVAGQKEAAVRLINTKNPRNKRKYANTPAMPLAMCQAQNKAVYLAGSDGTILSWQRMNKTDKTFKGHTDWVTGIAMSPNGKLLASVSLDGTTRLWDCKEGLLLATLLQLQPQSDAWLMITSQGTFNASSPDVVTFYNQADSLQAGLKSQWQTPEKVSQHLGFNAK